MNRAVTCLFLCVAPLLAAGCGPAGPTSYPVRGTVKLDGKPLPEGEVYFLVPGKAPAICAVKDGGFEGQSLPGKLRVEVYAYRERKEPVESPGPKMPPAPENYIPARYNAQSDLSAEVKAEGPNDFTFELKSR